MNDTSSHNLLDMVSKTSVTEYDATLSYDAFSTTAVLGESNIVETIHRIKYDVYDIGFLAYISLDLLETFYLLFLQYGIDPLPVPRLISLRCL